MKLTYDEVRVQLNPGLEFATCSTVLALHPSSARNPPGMVELGFSVDNLAAFMPPWSPRA
jgi:hypothetical protein